MATPVFIEAEYTDPPCTGLETLWEAGSTWLGATAYTHAARGNVVLWYGGETYEGLGGGYRWGVGGAPVCGSGSGAMSVLLDGDGDVVPTRWAQGSELHASSAPGLATPRGTPPARQTPAKFLPFGEALAVAQTLGPAGMSGAKEWTAWCKAGMRPAGLPSRPDQVYKDGGWQGWGHWLGTGNQQPQSKRILPFADALAVAQTLGPAGMSGKVEWAAWCKAGMRPAGVPSRPDQVYKDGGWQGWGHWLGTGRTRPTTQFLPFAEALAVAQTLGPAGMSGEREWRAWCKAGMRPAGVPSNPQRVYKNGGWQGWGHWLATGNQSNHTKQFLPFDEALRVARCLRLNTQKEWEAWCRTGARPANVPAKPQKVYVHDGWMGWVHWLYHANLDAGATPAGIPQPTRKRTAASASAGAPGNYAGKRGRR